jgi:hypothetical protein
MVGWCTSLPFACLNIVFRVVAKPHKSYYVDDPDYKAGEPIPSDLLWRGKIEDIRQTDKGKVCHSIQFDKEKEAFFKCHSHS